MPEIPVAMQKAGRHDDPDFALDENLYRRVPLILWDNGDDDIEIDAIALPDMSVLRGKYAHPEWARLESDDFCNWGVVGFRVEHIPNRLVHLGVFVWTFSAHHKPYRNNYPHSEVWAFEGSEHIQAVDRLTPDLHLRWREQLLRNVRKFVRPYEPREIRQEAP